MTGLASLSDLGNYCYGRISIFFINTLIALAQLGFPIIFFIVFGDVSGSLIERAHGSSSFWSTRWFTQSLLAIIMLYLILKKEIHQLKYAGLVVLTCIVVFLFLLFIHYLVSDPNPVAKIDLKETTLNIQFIAAFPTLISSYSINPAFFTAFASLKNKTNTNGILAGTLTLIIIFCVYVSSPLLAYALYGAAIKPNLLKNVSLEHDILPTILQFIFMIVAILHIPIIFFIGKEAVLIIFDEATRRSYSRPKNKVEPNVAPPKPVIDIEENQQPDSVQIDEQNDIQGHNDDSNRPIKLNMNPIYVQTNINEDRKNNENADQNDNKLPEPQAENNISQSQDEHGQSNLNNENVNQQKPKSGTTSEDEGLSEAESLEMQPVVLSTANPKEYLNMKPIYYYIITIICYVVVVLLSIVIGDVRLFFGIIGATTGSWVLFAGPGSFYIISIHKKKIPFDGAKSIILYIFAWIYVRIMYLLGHEVIQKDPLKRSKNVVKELLSN